MALDIDEALAGADRRILRRIAEAAETSTEAVAVQMIRHYIDLARSVPGVLPEGPLKSRLIAAARRA